MSKILITGSTGFIGKALNKYLLGKGNQIYAAVRQQSNTLNPNIQQIIVGDILPDAEWTGALKGIDVVIHLAARVHIMDEQESDPLTAFRKVNTDGTLNLARQAAEAGVKRFIFLSSIKVNGESTSLNKPFYASDTFIPSDPYGLSKYEAEEGLKNIAQQSGMQVVIIRPPLVYAPGVKANFLSMIHWLYRGIPLPLGAIHNKRSLVALDNLIDLINICINHPDAANQTFLISDDEDLSTTELLKRMGRALGKPARLIKVPSRILTTSASLLGKDDLVLKLCGSLQVDINKTHELLGWQPVISVDAALTKTAQHFLANRAKKS